MPKKITPYIASIILSACGVLPMGTPHNFVVDGNSIMYVENPGPKPTVVFESGLGDGYTAWTDVYNETLEFAHVFAYSRPGYSAGLQQPTGRERTADQVANWLEMTLSKAGIPPPYILVGHSIGGLYSLEFARQNPDLVAGIVLVDARLPGFTEQCELARADPCLPPDSAAAMSPPHVAAEIRGIRTSERFAPTPAQLGKTPAILIVATKPPPGGSPEAQEVWLNVQENFANSMANGTLIVAKGSGHYVQKDAPQVVVSAIRRLVQPGWVPGPE